MLKTVILDNENLVRCGISGLVNQLDDVRVVAELGSSKALFSLLREQTVSLIIMEWRLTALDGMETLARLVKVYPKIKVMVFSSYLTGTFPSHIWQLGVSGMVSRNDILEELHIGIKKVLRGERFVSAEVSKSMVSHLFMDHHESPFEVLTQREMQVLMMIVGGMRVQDISERLCISRKTVNTYRYRLFEKLGVTGEVGLTRLALRYGVIEDIPMWLPGEQGGQCESQFLLH